MTNPILIEVTRGALVESVHRGALAIVDGCGLTVLGLGDCASPVFARSAIKALQCLPLIETGAADRFGFETAQIALACASHAGTRLHADIAAGMLARIGQPLTCLVCGAHPPLSAPAAKALIEAGEAPSALHNNCSGKHAGMLATALHMGEATAGYWRADHPVQGRIRQVLADIVGAPFGPDQEAMDGCSVPTFALPLTALAKVFARLVTGTGLPEPRQQAARRILNACWREPDLVSGPGRLDSVVMARLPGRVFLKTGAEGVYCGGLPGLGLGFALKIDDGASRASHGATVALLERLVPEALGLVDRAAIRNWRGDEVGRVRTSAALSTALDGLHP